MLLFNKWNHSTELKRRWSPSLSIAICYLHLWTPVIAFSSLHPFQVGRSQDNSYPCIILFPLTFFPFFHFVAAESIFKENRLCLFPNWLERRNCLTLAPAGKESIIIDSLPPFLTLHFLVALLHPNLRMSKASWSWLQLLASPFLETMGLRQQSRCIFKSWNF